MKMLSDEFMPQRIHDRVPEADVKQNELFTMEPYESLTTISRDDEMDERRSSIGQTEKDGIPIHISDAKKGASRIGGPFRRVAWLGRTLCSLPASPVAIRSIDDGTCLGTESRSDDNTVSPATQYCDERQGAVSPCDFEVEIDDDGSHTQIEIKHSYDNACGWSSPYEELSENFCQANDSFNSNSPVSPARCINRENGNVFESLLEKNSFMCTGLDNWYNTSIDDYEHEPICKDVPEMPRNRSAFPAGRKKRIENLKINLTPFELDSAIFVKSSVNSKKYSPIEMEKRTRSFSQYKGSISPTSVANTTSTTEVFSCYTLPTCGQRYSTGSALVDWDENEEDDLCYDSDPNDLLVSSPMVAQAKKQKHGETVSRSAMYNSDRTVSELMGTKMLLVWHRSMHYEASPIAVNAWIEHGSYIQAGLIQPKLMWQESCGKERKDGERFILNDFRFHSVDLLDISRVIPLGRVDRTEYPFAKSSCSFFIQAFEKELIFEAESTAERDNFIEGLKVLVARLGSKIIVGEKDVLGEFFTPTSSEVPGTAPVILTEGGFDMTASIC